MTVPKTIDICTSNILFQEQDPIGLLPEASARRYLEVLRLRLRERFPKARVFLRWSPSTNEPPEIFTLPREAEQAKDELRSIVEDLTADVDRWLSYDESVREAFAS